MIVALACWFKNTSTDLFLLGEPRVLVESQRVFAEELFLERQFCLQALFQFFRCFFLRRRAPDETACLALVVACEAGFGLVLGRRRLSAVAGCDKALAAFFGAHLGVQVSFGETVSCIGWSREEYWVRSCSLS